jgi:hypothetical protein
VPCARQHERARSAGPPQRRRLRTARRDRSRHSPRPPFPSVSAACANCCCDCSRFADATARTARGVVDGGGVLLRAVRLLPAAAAARERRLCVRHRSLDRAVRADVRADHAAEPAVHGAGAALPFAPLPAVRAARVRRQLPGLLAAWFATGSPTLGALDFGDLRGCSYALFYSWVTAFSVCGVTLVWVHAVEWFSLAQGKRLFALVSIGGTLGAVVGSSCRRNCRRFDYATLCLLAAARHRVGCAGVVAVAAGVPAHGAASGPPQNAGGPGFVDGLGAWCAIRTCAPSPCSC